MADLPVVNASPLIFLSQADRLDYLQLVAPVIAVPAAVQAEINARGPGDVTARAVTETSWLEVVETPPVPAAIQAWDLGAGESSVLAWCHGKPGTIAIMDDLAARHCAAVFGIPVKGTLGIVLLAKQDGKIPAARPVLEELRQAGMYLSEKVFNRALSMVGE